MGTTINDYLSRVRSQVRPDKLEKAVVRLSPLFGMSPSHIKRENDFPDQLLRDIYCDGEYIQDKGMSNYVIGTNTGLYIHRKMKPDFYNARADLKRQFTLTNKKFPSLDDSIRYLVFLFAPFDRFTKFVGHYCGLFNEGGTGSMKQVSVRHRWVTQGPFDSENEEKRLVLNVCSSVQLREVVPPNRAAEHFLTKLDQSEFAKVLQVPLTSAYDHIKEVTGIDLKEFRL